MDKKIAAECHLVDLVIGGHTNTFLWNGPKPDIEEPEDIYPTLVKNAKTGKTVPVVQAYAYTKYMGRLHLKIDTDDGRITSWRGDPLLVNHLVQQDQDVLDLLSKYRKTVDELEHKIIGTTKVYLEGRDIVCRSKECNLGNLITDAFIDYRARQYAGSFWTDIPIAVINGGGIRMSIDARTRDGNITHADLAGVLPFNNDIVALTVSGRHLFEILEWSVRGNGETSGGEFLQFSGLRAIYDREKEPGSRVLSAAARCGACTVPTYEPVDPDRDYRLMITSFLALGGDGFRMIKKNAKNKTVLGINDFDCVVAYLERHDMVYPAEEGRVVVVKGGAPNLGVYNAYLSAGYSNNNNNSPAGVLVFVLYAFIWFVR